MNPGIKLNSKKIKSGLEIACFYFVLFKKGGVYMANIDSAMPSPRIVNGEILWFAGDEFELSFALQLEDADEEDIVLSSGDTVTVTIYDDKKEEIKKFVFNGPTDNTVTLEFNSDVSALFEPGMYFYDIRLSGIYKTTVIKSNRMRVE